MKRDDTVRATLLGALLIAMFMFYCWHNPPFPNDLRTAALFAYALQPTALQLDVNKAAPGGHSLNRSCFAHRRTGVLAIRRSNAITTGCEGVNGLTSGLARRFKRHPRRRFGSEFNKAGISPSARYRAAFIWLAQKQSSPGLVGSEPEPPHGLRTLWASGS